MPSGPLFVTLDDTAHVLSEDGTHTVCYLTVPYATTYAEEEPDKLCGQCSKLIGREEKAQAEAEAEAAPDAPEPSEPVTATKKAKKATPATKDAAPKVTYNKTESTTGTVANPSTVTFTPEPKKG